MFSAKSIAKNSFLYTGALIIQRVFSTLFFVYYSNNLAGGAHDLGRLQFVLSFVALIFIIGDLGLYLVFLREGSKKASSINSILNTLLVIKLPLMLLAIVVTLAAGFAFVPDDMSILVIALVWIIFDSLTHLFYGVLRSHQKLQYESIAVVVYQLIVLVVGVFLVHLYGSVHHVILAFLIGTLLNFSFALYVIIKKYGIRLHLRYDKKIATVILRALPAFAVAGILVKVLNTIDTVLLKILTENYVLVGLYSVPLKLINVLSLTLPTALMGAVYPAFSHLFKKSTKDMLWLFEKSWEYLLIISIPVIFGFFALGEEFIKAIWGDGFSGVIVPTKLMLLALPFIFLAFPTGNLLNATRRQAYTAMSRAIGVTVLVVVNIILIPEYGLYGAAIAFILTYVSIFISDIWFLRKEVRAILGEFSKEVIRVFIASLAMYLIVVYGVTIVPWYIGIVLGAVSYFTILWLIGGVDTAFVKKFVRSPF